MSEDASRNSSLNRCSLACSPLSIPKHRLLHAPMLAHISSCSCCASDEEAEEASPHLHRESTSGSTTSSSLPSNTASFLTSLSINIEVRKEAGAEDARGKETKMESEKRKLEEIRRQIDRIDDEIAKLIFKRIELAISARDAKKRMEMPISDAEREREVIEKWRERAKLGEEMGMNECIKDVYEEMFMRIGSEIVKYTLRIEEEWNMEEKKD